MPNPRLVVRPAGSFLQGNLPTGCALCEAGTKLVLFVTGVCHYKCFYCPISDEKRMARATWANERRLAHDLPEAEALRGIAEEARAIGAKGTGITGGDPMYDPERTVRYIRFLKAEFGPRHHVHIYTQIPFDARWLSKLADAGLDELRFHPPDEIWEDVDAHPRYAALYRAAKALEDAGRLDVGFEVPCIPGWSRQLTALVGWLDRERFRFVNLNEMEFSETNYAALLAKGYRIVDDVTMRTQGSEAVARAVMSRFPADAISIHFCSSPFKDAIQLRQRLRRRAERVARPHETVTDDGTLLRGVVPCPDPESAAVEIAAALGLPRAEVVADTARGRVELAPDALERVAKDLPWPAFVSEVYPTHEELEVERTPLNDRAGREPPAIVARSGRLVEIDPPEDADRRFGRPGGL